VTLGEVCPISGKLAFLTPEYTERGLDLSKQWMTENTLNTASRDKPPHLEKNILDIQVGVSYTADN